MQFKVNLLLKTKEKKIKIISKSFYYKFIYLSQIHTKIKS
ncbi:conserved hypothetical protein [Peptoniphilus harei ACS-146-V-Sch2b]|uniref:Uncharacterized protein n=1 Tax=Peptoniphilus harei ACS-146-V-Sch2b TaxID=908338 RepID=E4KZT8_9FIRM|nr:conserved hypothetical protein [Peptoniphilus harei ACS-146-V-Sch2b]